MPIERARLDRMIALMDAWLTRRDREIGEGTYYDDEEPDEPPRNPLDAPPSEPFYSDGPPEKIHGEGKDDQELWPPKPLVPVPIEHL
jgi:hypothetical protein